MRQRFCLSFPHWQRRGRPRHRLQGRWIRSDAAEVERGQEGLMDGYEVRPLDLDQVRVAVQWAEREGWEPGLTDAEPFFAADPQGGFFGGRLR